MLKSVAINARMAGRDGHVQHNTRRNQRERCAAPVKSHTTKDSLQQCQISSENVKEHAPPLARAHVETGVEVHNTGDVDDRAASGGCGVSSCSESSFYIPGVCSITDAFLA